MTQDGVQQFVRQLGAAFKALEVRNARQRSPESLVDAIRHSQSFAPSTLCGGLPFDHCKLVYPVCPLRIFEGLAQSA